ncbi:NAD(P)H-quinone oxidoreductase [Tatumella citrea]|uniref:NAD(P)H-quinone oxidoreductase n=1 Tax=Tatumella citrea TaxID=53336 RepID=A0A1Y0LKR2_TATCI|nr:NAD(P)H-quinone oxidoreductase [Tatumella citrea]ARU94030.1 NAD(P)H-quinone oxidoreductase [Tatumella citrea]ARU98068.1 NAD(P)H-quinone oxidoreductase [Tatumella citrea]
MLPEIMNAVIARQPGGADMLELVQRPVPQPAFGEVLIQVIYAGVNRPDIMQRNGIAVPPGVTDILGLEVSGNIVAVGAGVEHLSVGTPVMALLNGGGYAGYCIARAELCLILPESLSLAEAAGVPEAAFTVWHNLFELGRLQPGETVLIHGAASGVGTFALQCAQACGAQVIATAGGREKIAALRELGVWRAIDRHNEDFVEVINQITNGQGVDIVLDNVGGDYVSRNLRVLAPQGRHVSLGFMQGARIELDLQLIMRKGLSLTSSTLRPKSSAEKARLARCIEKHLLPLMSAGKISPVLHQIVPLADVAQAHRILETNANTGKVLLEVAPEAVV